MKFVVLKENLEKALATVSRNLSSKPQLPILSTILFKTVKNELTVLSTNLELGISYTIGVKSEKDGETAIPGKLLYEFVSSVRSERLTFSLEGTTLTVTGDKTKATFATMNASDYPPFPVLPPVEKKLPTEKIRNIISHVVFAASSDEARPILTGVKLVLAENKLQMIATDGYRLSIESIDMPTGTETFQAILPSNSLTEVIRVASELKSPEIAFSTIPKKNQMVFFLPQVVIYTNLIDGEFPNVEKIIPQSFKTKTVIDKDLFTQSIKTVSLFARGSANIIKLNIEKNGIRLSANTPQVGTNEDFVEATLEGEESEIAFNYRFLQDLLNNFPDKPVVFEMSGSLNPGLFKPEDPTLHFTHIIMPVRVQG